MSGHIKPTLEEAKLLSADGSFSVIPVALEIFSDQKTPIEVLRNLKQGGEGGGWYILESVNGGDNTWGRYTFLGYKPMLALHGKDMPFEKIREVLAKYKSPRLPYLPPFTGGLVGYFAYDFVENIIHGLKLSAKNSLGFDDYYLMLMDKVVVFDNFKQKVFLIVNVSAKDIDESYAKGLAELAEMERVVLGNTDSDDETGELISEFEPAFTEEAFCEMVRGVKRHIVEGDIFQAVVSNRFKAKYRGSLMNAYRTLRTTNPSPYMVYMKAGDLEIACASPETLVALRDGEISSFPLAGSCPRGKTEEEDVALIGALLADEKELAEHDMLVDLARNDVGKVSRFGSVKVSEYRNIKKFSHISHISSRVTGELSDGFDALDVIAAALPAGTLSGAPKKRACEIIDEAEGIRRGVYGGAIGYIDFTGNMDMCIGIRMAVLKDGEVYVQSGAGVVADSVPEKEYAETRRKARAVMDALKGDSNECFNHR